MTTHAVEPNEGTQHIAYCGIYCGSCPNHAGEIADLARDLRKKLREHQFERIAPALSVVFKPFANYPQCYETLGAMVKLRCKRGCCDGGGPPQCKIRNCARKHDFPGCWVCAEFEVCGKLDSLKPAHGDANIKNLKKIQKQGVDAFLAGKKYW
jgi:hypothetical protein